jgi:hypothetical protein
MALSSIQTNNKLIVFKREILREFVRQNMFSPYMGNGLTNIIRVLNDLKAGGEQVNVPLTSALRATAIANGTLVGAEEAIDNYGFRMWIDWARNAVKTNRQEIHRDSAAIYDIARPLLSDWGKELIKNEICDAFLSIPSITAPANLGTANGQRVNGFTWDNTTTSGASGSSNRDQWTSDNADRILFGNTIGNAVSNVWATAAALVDNTSGKLTGASLKLMKRRAMNAVPRIRPYQTNDGYDFWIAFCDPNAFRDLSNDQTIVNSHLYARPREGRYKENPLFNDGDILYDGVIVRQVPELLIRIPTLFKTAGAGGIQINAVHLCGQSAMCQFYGQLPRPTRLEQTDYDFNRGVGIEMAYGLGKVAKTTSSKFKEWGVFTGFFASVNDT